MDANQRFAELAGICWHEPVATSDVEYSIIHIGWRCTCGGISCIAENPDYCADPRLVLEVMMKREDWPKFAPMVGRWDGSTAEYFVRSDYLLDTTGLLAMKGIEWLERKEER
jgi:hypothetical protein